MKTLPFGWKNGQLVEVAVVASGLACGCVCPQCGKRLVAKKGEHNRHHFAHHRDSNCSGALETSIHLLAKQFLAKSKEILLPEVLLYNDEVHSEAQKIPIDKAWLEQSVDQIIPDLLLLSGKKQLAIEIAFTHPVTPQKAMLYRQLGLATIEFDIRELLNDWTEGAFPLALLRHHLLRTTDYKRWIFNPKRTEAEQEILAKAARRQVRKVRFKKGNPFYIVNHCPERKRVWKQSGIFYASVFGDCLRCGRCLDIDLGKEWLGEERMGREPRVVTCA